MIRIFQEKDKAKLFARLESRKNLVSRDIVGSRAADRVPGAKGRGPGASEIHGAVRQSQADGAAVARASSGPARCGQKGGSGALLIDLEKAIFNIYAYHTRQIQKSWEYSKRGVVLGQRVLPLDSVGVYVPGGSAAYPSSVLMNIIPAKIAGVPRIVVATPPGTFQQHPIIAAALHELNATEMYLIGGAQAVAALAYGTATIPRVDKIVGPGNAYVAGGESGKSSARSDIDMIAGPSEVVDPRNRGSSQPALYRGGHALAGGARRGRLFDPALPIHSPHADACAARDWKSSWHCCNGKRSHAKSLESYGAVDRDGQLRSNRGDGSTKSLAGAPGDFREHPDVGHRQGPECRIDFYGDYTPEAVGDYFAGSQPRASDQRDRALLLAARRLSFPAQDRVSSGIRRKSCPAHGNRSMRWRAPKGWMRMRDP